MAHGDIDFPTVLRAAIKDAGQSVRGLARKLSDGTPAQIEKERRALNRYLAGDHLPDRRNADRIADALNLPAGTFPNSEGNRSPRRTLAEQVAELTALVEEVKDIVEAADASDIGHLSDQKLREIVRSRLRDDRRLSAVGARLPRRRLRDGRADLERRGHRQGRHHRSAEQPGLDNDGDGLAEPPGSRRGAGTWACAYCNNG